MRRHLLVALVTVFGVLVFASGAFAADSLTLCVKKNGDIKAATTCKHEETMFVAVSATALDDLQAQVTTLEGKVTDLETLLAGVTRTAGPTLLFSGMNLQVVNGTGATSGSANGLGNVIIGYNTSGGNRADTKTGSHNLVVGDDHTYTNTSGIVAGNDNGLTGVGSFVSGHQNTAGGMYSSVGGGEGNTASGDFSFASGRGSTASGLTSFVAGFQDTASGVNAFASGRQNTASGNVSFASGWFNTASGRYSFVSGGAQEMVIGGFPPVNDGPGNTANGNYSFVGGGNRNTAPNSCANLFGTFFPTGCP